MGDLFLAAVTDLPDDDTSSDAGDADTCVVGTSVRGVDAVNPVPTPTSVTTRKRRCHVPNAVVQKRTSRIVVNRPVVQRLVAMPKPTAMTVAWIPQSGTVKRDPSQSTPVPLWPQYTLPDDDASYIIVAISEHWVRNAIHAVNGNGKGGDASFRDRNKKFTELAKELLSRVRARSLTCAAETTADDSDDDDDLRDKRCASTAQRAHTRRSKQRSTQCAPTVRLRFSTSETDAIAMVDSTSDASTDSNAADVCVTALNSARQLVVAIDSTTQLFITTVVCDLIARSSGRDAVMMPATVPQSRAAGFAFDSLTPDIKDKVVWSVDRDGFFLKLETYSIQTKKIAKFNKYSWGFVFAYFVYGKCTMLMSFQQQKQVRRRSWR